MSVIIPTKNRPSDLLAAVRSIFAQSFAPLSLLIVDQSSNDEGRRGVQQELAMVEERGCRGWQLNYILDPTIAGASAARNHAMTIADGDIWLFLDDDVVLETDFVEKLLAAYRYLPDAVGISGIITNYPPLPLPYRVWSAVFARGPFRDERQRIYWNADVLREVAPIPVRHFTGALMSFRSKIVQGIYFDEYLDKHFRGVSDGEDIAFCEKLGSEANLFIAPSARLRHNHSSIGRLTDHWLRRHVRANLFLYKRYYFWKVGTVSRLYYGWLWVGYSLVAVLGSARRLSLEPWRAVFTALGEARQVCSTNPTLSAEARQK